MMIFITTGSVNIVQQPKKHKRRQGGDKEDVDDPFNKVNENEIFFRNIHTDEIVNNKESEVFKFPPSGEEVSILRGKLEVRGGDILKKM